MLNWQWVLSDILGENSIKKRRSNSFQKAFERRLCFDWIAGVTGIFERISFLLQKSHFVFHDHRISFCGIYIERLFIQWGFSQVFPAKTMCAHVTTWNKNSSVKFRTDVAMMCKLGFDIKLADMSKDDETYCRTAVQNYNRLKPVVLEGDMYRLISPYGSNHTSTMYVGKDKDKAVVFAFDIHPRYAEKTLLVRLQGLDADKMYRVKEINLMPGANSSLSGNGEVFSGEFLMNVGLNLFTTQQLNSRVVEVVAE